MTQSARVLVVLGTGGVGEAIARRIGAGQTIVLADHDEPHLRAVADGLAADGFDVQTRTVDVSSKESVGALGAYAVRFGAVSAVAHTAGLSPAASGVEAILRVNLLGAAHVIDEFEGVVGQGGSAVFIASMAAHLGSEMDRETERTLARIPTGELSADGLADEYGLADAAQAYRFTKRAVQLRVAAAASAWGARGARINSISPGHLATRMGRAELDGPNGDRIRALINASAAGRDGTAADIANVAAFLLGPDAAFITGTDVLVDGGVVAQQRYG